jgi:hypothetical protein
MKNIAAAVCGLAISAACFAQSTFTVTGTPIPSALVQQNYGNVPKGVVAYDLNICNSSAVKQSVVSSAIYQAVAGTSGDLQPIGRQIILAAILRNQSHSPTTIVNVALNSATTVLSILSSSKYHVPSGLITGVALASVSGQQVMADLKPLLAADQLEKFETQVLEPALVLDAGSCVERTVFAVAANPKTKQPALSFHVR